MNGDDPYLINLASSEYPDWQPAHWECAGDINRFHWMRLDANGHWVFVHDSAIKRLKADTKPLENEIRRLLEHGGLVPEARKLIAAALLAQSTGSTNFTI